MSRVRAQLDADGRVLCAVSIFRDESNTEPVYMSVAWDMSISQANALRLDLDRILEESKVKKTEAMVTS